MKRGYIKITDELYKDWELVYPVFKNAKPIHIEFRHWENDMWYIYCEGDIFEELNEGEQIPQYEVIFSDAHKGAFTYTFKRVK